MTSATIVADLSQFPQSLIAIAAAAISLLSTMGAQATDRFFHDITVTSPNGRYVAEATSPDNAGGRWRIAFQSRFTYRLMDKRLNRELWSRPQPMTGDGRWDIGEGPPVAIYIADDGWVVIRTADVWRQPIELIAMSPTGEESIRVKLFETLFPDHNGRWRYTGISTAGTLWGSGYCHFYFISIRNTPYFCMRAWWGNHLLLDLTAGRQVEVGAELGQELFKAEKQFVIETLKGTDNWAWTAGKHGFMKLSGDVQHPSLGEGLRAIHMAGMMKLSEAAPLLQKLESCPYVGATSGSSGPYKAKSGGIKPYSHKKLAIRQLSQISLRRLGVRPSGHQATMLYRVDGGYWYPPDPLPYRRETKAGQVAIGMKPEQVLDTIGAPDFIRHRVWEYDMDDETPYTLIISWDANGVEKAARHAPAKWTDDVTRDREFTH
jgi:hypothetical protein